MFGAITHFFRNYVSPSRGRLLFNLQMPCAVFVGLLLAFRESSLSKIIDFDVISVIVNYNFMSFGFTIAALSIVFAIPNSSFQDYMFRRSREHPERGQGPWEDALFIMAWNGFVHFVCLVLSLVILLFSFEMVDGERLAIYSFSNCINKLIYSIFIISQTYTIIQFLMTMLSVYFFCSLYVRAARREWERSNPS